MIKIENIKLRNILNSAGNTAFEVEIIANNGIIGTASCPSAIIPGKREVFSAKNIEEDSLNKLISEICSKEIEKQEDFDNIVNDYMQTLGSSICLPFSLVFARIMAQVKNVKLTQYISELADSKATGDFPIPLVTIFSGGVHNKKGKGSIQNIMIAVNIKPFSKAVQIITKIYSLIESELLKKDILKSYGASSGMIVEKMTTNEKFEMLISVIKELECEEYVSIAIDVAAEHFFKDGIYTYLGKQITSKELKEILSEYIKNYNITYIEDPFDFNDEEYWKKIRLEHKNIDIVGDDLFATQDKYINNELANGILLKMNQVGTLTGTIKAFKKAKSENMITCVSHRSIETEDTFMCDLAVALSTKYIKIGGPRRGDRIIKYNRLLRLEESSYMG